MIRVYINNSFPGDQLDIAILNVGEQPGDSRYVLRQHVSGEGDQQYLTSEWQRLEDSFNPGPGTLRLQHDVAAALLRALTTHFQGGVDDLAMLRKDYTAERDRVDKLIDVVARSLDTAIHQPYRIPDGT